MLISQTPKSSYLLRCRLESPGNRFRPAHMALSCLAEMSRFYIRPVTFLVDHSPDYTVAMPTCHPDRGPTHCHRSNTRFARSPPVIDQKCIGYLKN